MNVSRNRLRGPFGMITAAAVLAVFMVPAPAQDAEPIASLLADADPAQGETLTRQCAACHTFDEGGPNRVGPNLWDIVGRPKASVESFNYSPVMQELGGEWTYEDLNNYLADPRGYAPGNRMAFVGVRDINDRADLIAYLRSLSAEPAPLPE